MTFNQQNRKDNENKKFVADADGNTAVRATLTDGIHFTSSTSSLKFYDHRGFLVAEICANGDIKRKGRDIKIP